MIIRICILILFSQLAVAQQKDTLYVAFPEQPKLSVKFVNQVSIIRATYLKNNKTADDKAIETIPLSSILDKLEQATSYQELLLIRYWMSAHYSELIPELIIRVKNKKLIGLTDYGDLVIWERIRKGNMKYYGHGEVVKDDLFTLAGRSNWLLKEISGENPGIVSMYSSNKQLDQLQSKWISWIRSL